MGLFSRKQTVAAATSIARRFVIRAIDRCFVDVRSVVPSVTDDDGKRGHIVRVEYCSMAYDVLVIDRKIERVDYYAPGDDVPVLPKLEIKTKEAPRD